MELAEFKAAHESVLEAVSQASAQERAPTRGEDSAACRTAKRNLADAQNYLNAFNAIILAVAIATAVSLIVAIIMLFLERKGGAIAGGVGTIVTGAAMGFILKMRADARGQVKELTNLRDKYCLGS